jgi:hypothetical protein
MLIAILILGVGPRGTAKLKLTRRCVYWVTLIIVALLLLIFIMLRISQHKL